MDLTTPRVMGILNVTPDSFYDGGYFTDPEAALVRTKELVEQEADIIDIGAASSRPGAVRISAEEEIERLHPVMSLLRNEFPDIIISLDTYNSETAKEMVETFSIDIINDISAGGMDEAMFTTIAALNVPYIIMHMQGTPLDMQENPEYENVTDDILQYFSHKVNSLIKKGISDILIDPGFGFGKTLEQNYELLSHMCSFQMFELPVVAGISRKSMIQKIVDSDSSGALNGTTAAHMLLLQKGVDILRVHDVREARETVKIFLETRKYS